MRTLSLAAGDSDLESWAATPAKVNAWLAKAQRGDRYVYARASCLQRGSAVAAHVRALHERGDVTLNRMPIGNGLADYVVTRLDPRRARSSKVIARVPGMDGDMRAMLVLLDQLARNMRPCPTNKALARGIGHSDPEKARYAMRRLRDIGRIDWRVIDRASGARIVTLLPSGRETADPEVTA